MAQTARAAGDIHCRAAPADDHDMAAQRGRFARVGQTQEFGAVHHMTVSGQRFVRGQRRQAFGACRAGGQINRVERVAQLFQPCAPGNALATAQVQPVIDNARDLGIQHCLVQAIGRNPRTEQPTRSG